MPVGFAIDRSCGDAQLYPITQCFCKAVTGRPRLHPDIEHKITILPLIKHDHSLMMYTDRCILSND